MGQARMVGLAGVGTDAVAMQALASYGRDNDARDDGGETQSDDDDLLLLGATPDDAPEKLRGWAPAAPGGGSRFERLLDLYIEMAVLRPALSTVLFLSFFVALGVVGLVAFPVTGLLEVEGTPVGPVESLREDSVMLAQEATIFNPNSCIYAQPEQSDGTAYAALNLVFWRPDGATMLDDDSMAVVRSVETAVMADAEFGHVCLKAYNTTEANAAVGARRCDENKNENKNGARGSTAAADREAAALPCLPPGSLNSYLYVARTDCGGSAWISDPLATSRSARATFRFPAVAPLPTTPFMPVAEAVRQLTLNTSNLNYCTATINLTGIGIPGFGGDAFCMNMAALSGCTVCRRRDYATFCMDNAALAGNVTRFLAKEYDVETHPVSAHVGSFVSFGLPLRGYENAQDRHEEQASIVDDWLKRIRPILDGADAAGVRVGTDNSVIFFDYFFNDLLPADMSKIGFAVGVVWLACVFKLDSLLLATLGLVHIIFSFVVGYFFWTQMVLDLGDKMPMIAALVPFLILGIGADDLFIFMDAWRQSEDHIARAQFDSDEGGEHKWLQARLKFSYRRSAWAMLITSLTTGVAFVQLLMSSILGIRVMGFAAAMTVLTDYFMVISYFPCLVMWWHRDFKSLFRVYRTQTRFGAPVERFFELRYATWLYRRRHVVLAAFAVFTSAAVASSAQLTASSDGLQLLPDMDRYQQAVHLADTGFRTESWQAQVDFIHGVAMLDRAGASSFHPEDIGEPRFVGAPAFDPSAPTFQQEYLDFCDRVRSWRYVVRDPVTGVGEVMCPMELFRDFVTEHTGAQFPVPPGQFEVYLGNFSAWYEQKHGPAPALANQKTVTKRVLRRQYGQASVYDLIRFGTGPDHRLQWLMTVANVTYREKGNIKLVTEFNAYFDSQMDAENARATMQAAGLVGGFQSCWQYVNAAIQSGLELLSIQGIGCGLGLSFVVIAVATGDMWLSFLTTASIACSVAALIATMVWMGWELGTLEAVCVAVLVGLSVDYSLHFAVVWRSMGAEPDRAKRTAHVLGEVGISVIMASVTTMLSALFLCMCYITFYQIFGTFILLAIFYSSLFSFGLLMALLATVGPVSPRNDFFELYSWGRRLLGQRRIGG